MKLMKYKKSDIKKELERGVRGMEGERFCVIVCVSVVTIGLCADKLSLVISQ